MSNVAQKPLLSKKSIILIGIAVAGLFIVIPCAVIVTLLTIGSGYINSIQRTLDEPAKVSVPPDPRPS